MTDARDHSLITRVIAGVLRNAQDGELPLFAWTLGQPQAALVELVEHCFPELGPLEAMPEHQYAAIRNTAPAVFSEMTTMLITNCTPMANPLSVYWLARAIAAASLGSRHLWQDLNLSSRDEVSSLLKQYFQPLYERNTQNAKWKRFLYTELGTLQGNPEMKPPECGKCEQFLECISAHS